MLVRVEEMTCVTRAELGAADAEQAMAPMGTDETLEALHFACSACSDNHTRSAKCIRPVRGRADIAVPRHLETASSGQPMAIEEADQGHRTVQTLSWRAEGRRYVAREKLDASGAGNATRPSRFTARMQQLLMITKRISEGRAGPRRDGRM